jgi:hypothetical protein
VPLQKVLCLKAGILGMLCPIKSHTQECQMRNFVLFNSWQTDRPSKSNKHFIKSCLDKAAKKVKQDLLVEDSSRPADFMIDQDTLGLPGSPDIVKAILDKIDICDIFFADLTYVAKVPRKHGVSNPNVLTERGYALKSVGGERMIAVMNTAYGSPDKLPFDLKSIRWPLLYNLTSTSSPEQRKATEDKLVSELVNAISVILKSGVLIKKETDSTTLIQDNILDATKQVLITKLFNNETEKVLVQLKTPKYDLYNPVPTYDLIWQRAESYVKDLSTIIPLVILGCRWGDSTYTSLWVDLISRLGNLETSPTNLYEAWRDLSLMPPLFLFYAAGITLLKCNKYETFKRLFEAHVKIPNENYEDPIYRITTATFPLAKHTRQFDTTNYSQKFLREAIRPYFIDLIPKNMEYDYFFFQFELIFNLVRIHNYSKTGSTHHGIFCALQFRSLKSDDAFSEFEESISKQKQKHPLVSAGLFDGDFQNVLNAINLIREYIKSPYSMPA